MLRISQLHGFNAIPSAASAGTTPGNPDHAWRFESAPNTLVDVVAGDDFTQFGSPSTDNGINGQCIKFTSVSQYLTESNAISASEFSICGWFQVGHIAGGSTRFTPARIVNGGALVSFEVVSYGSGVWEADLINEGTSETGSLSDLYSNQWNFFCLIRKTDTSLVLHVNDEVLTHPDAMAVDGDVIEINSGSAGVSGGDLMMVDEYYLFDGELSAAQVSWLYNGGTGRFVDGSGQF